MSGFSDEGYLGSQYEVDLLFPWSTIAGMDYDREGHEVLKPQLSRDYNRRPR